MITNKKLSSNFIKLLLCAVLFLTPVLSFSQTIIPMPIYYGEGGDLTDNQSLALLIALNIPMLLIYIVRSFMWIFKRNDYTYYEYVIFSDVDFIIVDFNSICFVVINGIGLIVLLSIFISNLLQ